MAEERLALGTLGMEKSERQEKGHWATGRVGDIDFIGSSRSRGKVSSIHMYLPYF